MIMDLGWAQNMKMLTFLNSSVVPSKVVCVGRNYMKHIEEMGSAVPEQPVFFIKPNSAVSNSLLIDPEQNIEYEAELCFLIRAKQLVGVGFGLDLTKRGVQAELKAKGLPWERAKAFDGSAVFSEFVAFDGEFEALSLNLFINGKLVQKGSVTEMLNKPAALLKDAQQFLSFEDNDVLMTGTPSGVGAVSLGDQFIGQVWSAGDLILEATWQAASSKPI